MSGKKLDFTHKINHLSFGEINDAKFIENNFNEKFNYELDGRFIDSNDFKSNLGFVGPDNLLVNYFLEIS